jgi:hypothetical protein
MERLRKFARADPARGLLRRRKRAYFFFPFEKNDSNSLCSQCAKMSHNKKKMCDKLAHIRIEPKT